ncbi:carboxypeptidase regulatory-like domain-containing protein [Bremerella cremea]|uniref:Carboxypeptidase regulatory-like domain-containing protein n=1 Tax=Bremerella cremea TaxID=1031537 RepID=A0A368KVJ2_9BACT|nr:carboxypeptidase-like regulatory domain-containing protein [Bremerella cremea]RCS54450.1 carboxypeptidase regulatory-like domain-containing protein [Bremerella cremea]
MRMSLFLGAVVVASLVGCTGSDIPKTYPVTGSVTYKGKPVEGANITLVSSDPAVRSAGAESDAEGKFSVKTYFSPKQQAEGVVPGDYVITVSKMEKHELPEGMKPEEAIAAFREMGPAKNLLPKKFASPQSSDLKISVTDTAPEPLVLDLSN